MEARITYPDICICNDPMIRENIPCPAHPPERARGTKSAAPAKLRELTSAERKAAPLQSGVLAYFPDALLAVARHSKAGNDKHNPGQHLHWAREKSTDQLECAARHLLTPDKIDPETGTIELVAAAWRILAALQLREEKRLVADGIMPLSGIVPDEIVIRVHDTGVVKLP